MGEAQPVRGHAHFLAAEAWLLPATSRGEGAENGCDSEGGVCAGSSSRLPQALGCSRDEIAWWGSLPRSGSDPPFTVDLSPSEPRAVWGRGPTGQTASPRYSPWPELEELAVCRQLGVCP